MRQIDDKEFLRRNAETLKDSPFEFYRFCIYAGDWKTVLKLNIPGLLVAAVIIGSSIAMEIWFFCLLQEYLKPLKAMCASGCIVPG